MMLKPALRPPLRAPRRGPNAPREGVGVPNPLELRRSTAPESLTLPSPYSGVGSDMVHPSVVYSAAGWSGYNRWMAVTPYPTANDDYENPCILASNDGTTWDAPPGLTNPLIPQPGGGYNSDPHLAFSPDGSKLYLLYRYNHGSTEPRERLMLCESTDGVNWTSPQLIYSANQGTRRLVSPSMWWNGSEWVIVAHDIVQAGNPLVRMANGGADPYTGWPAAPSAVTAVHPMGRNLWHSHFLPLGGGHIAGIIQDNGSGGGFLVAARSTDDGRTFALCMFDMRGGLYRSCMVMTGPASAEVYPAFISPTPTKVQRSSGLFDRTAKAVAVRAEVDALIAAAGAATLVDGFERADAASLGTALSGQSYTVDTGSFGISSGRAYSTSTGNCRALVDLGSGGENVRLFGRWPLMGTESYLIFRAQNSTNYWRFGFNSGVPRLQKIVSGAVNTSVQIGGGTSAIIGSNWFQDALFEIVANGNSFTVLCNGEPWHEQADTPTTSQTKVGFQASGATATYMAELAAYKL